MGPRVNTSGPTTPRRDETHRSTGPPARIAPTAGRTATKQHQPPGRRRCGHHAPSPLPRQSRYSSKLRRPLPASARTGPSTSPLTEAARLSVIVCRSRSDTRSLLRRSWLYIDTPDTRRRGRALSITISRIHPVVSEQQLSRTTQSITRYPRAVSQSETLRSSRRLTLATRSGCISLALDRRHPRNL